MKKVYIGIDIGSNEIKIVANEVIDDKFFCLAATSVPSKGVHKGFVVDVELATISLKEALLKEEELLGIKLDKAIICIPSYQRELSITTGEIEVTSDDHLIKSTDVTRVLADSVLGSVKDGYELITVTPIAFRVDDDEGVKDPRGQVGSTLSVKAVIASIPKDNLKSLEEVLKNCNLEAVDMAFSETGDYYEARNSLYDKEVGAIVNIGYETIKVSIYNKGIMIKDEVLDTGSKNIDKDIQYVYHVSRKVAKYLKENFAVGNKRYADINDTIEVTNKNGEQITLNQLEISEIVEARLIEMLRLAKKQINILTNREISYIIITGGISELAGFQYVVDNELGRSATTYNITSLGIRNNKYTSASGITKYFHKKLELRGKTYSMFNDNKSEDFVSAKGHKNSLANDTIISRVFGYFFDNN
ncbi:MAG: cell division FtsA domain-containing protein [Bacilli bacterium]